MGDPAFVTCWKCGCRGRVLAWEQGIPVDGQWPDVACAPGMGLHDWEKPTPQELIEAGDRSMQVIRWCLGQ